MGPYPLHPADPPRQKPLTGEIVLSGFATEAEYDSRSPSWEPDLKFGNTDAADHAAHAWLEGQGVEAQVEVVGMYGGEGSVLEIVTQDGIEIIARRWRGEHGT